MSAPQAGPSAPAAGTPAPGRQSNSPPQVVRVEIPFEPGQQTRVSLDPASGQVQAMPAPGPAAAPLATPAEVAALPQATFSLSAAASRFDALQAELQLSLTPASAGEVEWFSSQPQIVRVSASGLARSLANGEAVITAVQHGRRASMSLTVAQRPVSLAVQPNALSVLPGERHQLNVSLTDRKGQAVTGASLQWRSQDPAIAEVSAEGLLSAKAAGRTELQVSSDGVDTTVRVEVLATSRAGDGGNLVIQPQF